MPPLTCDQAFFFYYFFFKGGRGERKKKMEWSFSDVLFLSQSEKSPESGIFTCDPTKKCIMPSFRERHKGIIGRGHDLI